MQMCKPHWEELKTKLKERGLGKFIAKDGAEVIERLHGDDVTKTDAERFEPLMSAYMAITMNSMEAAGLAIMMPAADGSDTCPLCYLVSHCECGKDDCSFKTWLDHAVEDQVDRAGKLGLLEVNQ